ncbi:MAG: hypothetical protein HY294_08300 [Candidatus Rokubacteria bacterium]|nr:hypothetical protein [Candidatus Rokubacteria bacterium]
MAARGRGDVLSDEQGFARFEAALDDEWQRAQLAARLAPAVDERALAAALERADPLAALTLPGWRPVLRAWVGSWPARLAFAAVLAVVFAVGLLVGLASDPRTPRLTAATPLPTWEGAERVATLGAAGRVRAESAQAFHAAMSLYGAADFAARALPLLRDAVASDPTNEAAQFWLGVTLLRLGEAPRAVRPLEEAARLAPANGLYRRWLVFAYLQIGAIEQALRAQAAALGAP